jgi:hypothetical protein
MHRQRALPGDFRKRCDLIGPVMVPASVAWVIESADGTT